MVEINENMKESFIKYLKIELNYSSNTIENYMIDIVQFEKLVQMKFENVKDDNINTYLAYLKENYKASSHSRKVSSLKKFYKFLNNEYNVNNVFANTKTPKKEKRIPTYFSQEELNKFLNSIETVTKIDKRDKAMFELLYATGMRISEILNLKVYDIKFSDNFVIVTGKGNRQRQIPVSDLALKFVEDYLKIREEFVREKVDVLFLNNHGKQMTRQGFDKVLKKRALNVGITNVSAHKFRHSIATHLLNNGADLKMIQNFLGHVNISTTEIYTHLSTVKVKEEYEEFLELDIKD